MMFFLFLCMKAANKSTRDDLSETLRIQTGKKMPVVWFFWWCVGFFSLGGGELSFFRYA